MRIADGRAAAAGRRSVRRSSCWRRRRGSVRSRPSRAGARQSCRHVAQILPGLHDREPPPRDRSASSVAFELPSRPLAHLDGTPASTNSSIRASTPGRPARRPDLDQRPAAAQAFEEGHGSTISTKPNAFEHLSSRLHSTGAEALYGDLVGTHAPPGVGGRPAPSQPSFNCAAERIQRPSSTCSKSREEAWMARTSAAAAAGASASAAPSTGRQEQIFANALF